MKKVLIIAFIYPPLGGSGVQRTLKFSKYLPEFGWQPYVVCSDAPDAFGDGLDPSLVAEIPPQVKIWRRPFVSPLGLRRRVQKLLGLRRNRGDKLSVGGNNEDAVLQIPAIQAQPSNSQHLKSKFQILKSSLFRLLASPLSPFEFPAIDAALYWTLAIVPGCLKIIRQEKIDLIFTTSFPYSDHVAGYLLKKLTGKPWVADFRDPWTQNTGAHNSGWRYRVDRWMEQRVLGTAERVIGVTPTYTADLRCLASRRPIDRFVTIENGFDQADFQSHKFPSVNGKLPERDPQTEQNSPPASRLYQRPLVLAHVGMVYDGTALPFLQALAVLGPSAEQLLVRFIGGLPAQETAWLAEHPLSAPIYIEPRRPHAQAIQAMQQAGVLLLFALGSPGRSGHYPGKLFEYMASGTPILMVGPEGDAAELVQRSGTGCFIPANQPDRFVSTLRILAEQPGQFLSQYFHPQAEVIAAFERNVLTGKLASLFNEQMKVHLQ